MKILLVILATVLLGVKTLVPICAAEPANPPQTVKGDLLMIKGGTYVVRDIFGYLVYLRVDKDTKTDRLIVPGEKIEAQMSHDGHALSIKPAH